MKPQKPGFFDKMTQLAADVICKGGLENIFISGIKDRNRLKKQTLPIEVEIVWMVDESSEQFEYEMGGIIQVFNVEDCVVR